ncbi:MAG: glycosyltransferase family 2 protein [Vicinamibacterales bacterium]
MPSADSPILSIVVPAFEEHAGIVAALDAIAASVRGTALSFEIILVDDGSSDGTWDAVRALAARMPELRGLRLSRNFGKEGAIAAGLDLVRGEACVVMDADLQHPPELLPQMIRLWREEGYEVVDAVKDDRGLESWGHRLVARTFYRFSAAMTGYDLQDAADYKLLDRRVLAQWRRFGERGTFFRGLVAWLGFRRARVPFSVPPRRSGQSRWSLLGLASLAVHAVTSFSALPLQVVTVFGALMLALAFVVGLQALRLWLEGEAMPGITTVILLQLIIGGLLMVSLGIIGTYIARVYDEVKARPRYVVAETFGAAAPGSGTTE